MRFRRSVTIAKGLRLNFSKSGVSATIGGKGLSVNIGKSGTYLNTGIPGTGLYDRVKIGDTPGKGSGAKGQARAKEALPAFAVSLDEEGAVVLLNSANQPIRDEGLLRRIKKTPTYKEEYAQAMEVYKKAIEEKTQSFINIYQLSAKVEGVKSYETRLNTLAPQQYQPQHFDKGEPQIEAARAKLEEEAMREVKTLLFWQRDEKRKQYVAQRLPGVFEESYQAWIKEKRAFEQQEKERGKTYNQQYQEEYQNQLQNLTLAMEGGEEYIEQAIGQWLEGLELPVDFAIQYEYQAEPGLLWVDLDLPEIEHLPAEKAVELASGAVKAKAKSQKELKGDYVTCVFGLAVFFASWFFTVSPHIRGVCLSGYTQRRNDKTGDMEDRYLYSIQFTREVFEKTNLGKTDPYPFSMTFTNRANLLATGDLKAIVPFNIAGE